jgi:hypothetical protein
MPRVSAGDTAKPPAGPDYFPVNWKIVGMERALAPFIQADLARKMVFLSGPRQAGKTTLALDLQISPTTLGRYQEILGALHIVFTVRPFHRNIARALLKEPKVYFLTPIWCRATKVPASRMPAPRCSCVMLNFCRIRPAVPSYLVAIAERFPGAGATLLVRHMRQPEQRGPVAVERAAEWLAQLAA